MKQPNSSSARDAMLVIENSGLHIPIRDANVLEATIARIGGAIRTGSLSHGQQLPAERVLATNMGISRVTLRAALKVIAEAGLIEVRRGRTGGAFVKKVPLAEISSSNQLQVNNQVEQLLDYRLIVECGIAELAARKASKSQLSKLRELVGHMAELTGNIVEFRKYDGQFHTALAKACSNAILIQETTRIQEGLGQLLSRLPASEEALQHSNLQHSRILACIAKHDANEARSVMAEHLNATRHMVEGLLVRL